MRNIIRSGDIPNGIITGVAHSNDGEIRTRLSHVARNILNIAKLLKENRDNKYYQDVGFDTWYSYLGDLNLAESTVRSWIHVYEMFELELAFPRDKLQAVGISKLNIISPVAYDDPIYWVDQAENNSKGDLINEVREYQGKEPMPYLRRGETPTVGGVFTKEEYVAHVDNTEYCIICGKFGTEKHHFPKTKGAGGKDYHVLPLCRWCHTEFHNNGKDFLWENRQHIFNYFYRLLIKED